VWGALVVALALALTGCGGSSPDAASGPPATAACLPASTELLAQIQTQADPGVQLLRGAAWKSPDFANVYFVAATFSATGVANQTGVWAAGGLTDPSAIMAVDGFAQQFTSWPDGDSSDAKISAADPGVDRAIACLKA
jgi:hypothetical protein